MRARWTFVITLALTAVPSLASAQPVVRDHRDKAPERRRPVVVAPREAPPPEKAETPGEKAGFVWLSGRWDWRADKWEWVPGHWERERAGKSWRKGRWEKRGDSWAYAEGTWGDRNDPPPTPTPPPVANDDRPREPPPPPRQEKREAARAGFVWAEGEWDWRGRKWEWVPGHWERERAGKKWRPSRWEQRDGSYTRTPGDWIDDGPNTPPPPVANDDRPREPPPPPREEKREAARAGFVWAEGEWDWRSHKWEWVPGHWERERAGKKWRPSRWEQRDGAYTRTAGDWIDDGPNSPNMPPPPRNTGPRPPRRDWKIERPIVSNYWPSKGKPGAKVVIRGRNLPKDATVLWGNTEVRGVKVTDTELRFIVPPDATSGLIAIRTGRGRPLAVGNFEVAAGFDAEADRKRLEDESRKRAEAEWASRQNKLAKDRAAREAAVKQRYEDRVAKREQRRADRLEEIRGKYARAFLADDNTQDELDLHAQRIAELERMTDIAEIRNDTKLAVRVEVLRTREDERHDQRMAALDAAFRAGGAP